jgi:aminoglycoside phosphotransferase (APT) family kinase protein
MLMRNGTNGRSGLLDSTIVGFLEASGLAPDAACRTVTPLTGGVASDIWKVETSERTFALKRALAQLRVAQVWTAPVSRNASEVAWMLEASRAAPGHVPAILASDAKAGVFAMTYLDPADHPVWKALLRDGHADPAFAAAVGETLAAIHAATAGSAEIAHRFDNDETFRSIRIEPYLDATAKVHPDLSGPLARIADGVMATKHALVHGDVSPKNILAGPFGPVFLDAECAWYGDPAFDLAFCLNHLLLKCIWTPSATAGFLAAFDALQNRYLAGVTWEPPADVEARAAALLPALLLARIDGKSPVEYITDAGDKNRVRRVARSFIETPSSRLQDVRRAWEQEIIR